VRAAAKRVPTRHDHLVEERTDNVARLCTVSLRGATDLLGGKYDRSATTPALEVSLPKSVRPPAKKPAVDLATIPGIPGKLEGVAVLITGPAGREGGGRWRAYRPPPLCVYGFMGTGPICF
jgi:hypothetical protein